MTAKKRNDKLSQKDIEMMFPEKLTSKEKAILQLIAEGDKRDVVAEKVLLGESSVRRYMLKIMDKLKAKNKTHAVAIAIRKGVIQ